MGSCRITVNIGYESTSYLCNNLLGGGIGVLEDDGEGTSPGPKDGMVVGTLLVLGLRCIGGPEEGARRVQ